MSVPLEDLIQLLREGDDLQRMAAIHEMSDLGDPRTAEMLMTVLLFDERAYVRYDATLALEQIDPARGAEFLESIVQDATRTLKIRCRAIKALGHLGSAKLVPLLEDIIDHGEEPEAATAHEALQHIQKRL